jgi:hypothetical protein
MRYSEWWYHEFPKRLKPYFNEIVILGENFINGSLKVEYNKELFSPVDFSIELECQQVQDYLYLL